MKRKISGMLRILCVIVAVVAMASCSTTRRLGPDDTLYTGVKKIEIIPAEGEKIDSDIAATIKEAVNVAPNNSIISPYWRYPFPVGLWVYNNWSNPPSGLKHWLYEKLVEQPVLIDDVRPELRTKMIEDMLDDNGYFRAAADYG